MPWALFFAACPGNDTGASGETGDSGPGGCFSEPASVQIGETLYADDGRASWAPMEEGSEQTMIHGPQGGWHVLASARADDVDEIVTLEYRISVPSRGVEVSVGTFRVMLVPEGDCGGYYPGMYGILDVSAIEEGDRDTPPELLAGETLRLSMDLTDASGRTASDTVDVIAALDPADEPQAE